VVAAACAITTVPGLREAGLAYDRHLLWRVDLVELGVGVLWAGVITVFTIGVVKYIGVLPSARDWR